jgi:hypothetical protein
MLIDSRTAIWLQRSDDVSQLGWNGYRAEGCHSSPSPKYRSDDPYRRMMIFDVIQIYHCSKLNRLRQTLPPQFYYPRGRESKEINSLKDDTIFFVKEFDCFHTSHLDYFANMPALHNLAWRLKTRFQWVVVCNANAPRVYWHDYYYFQHD